MLCRVCIDGLEGMWDPSRSKRLALAKDFDNTEDSRLQDSELQVLTSVNVVQVNHPGSMRPDQYVFGHHKTKESFDASIQEGCAMCNRFRGDGAPNPKIQELGYFSVFLVRLPQGKETTPKPLMHVYIGQSSGGFGFVPVGGMNLD